MSAYEEIVEESGDYRAVIVQQEYADKPESYGMVPVIQVDSNGWGSVKGEAFNEQAEQYVDAFNRLSDLYYGNGYQYEVFERYLRIFHGATKVESHNIGVTREYGYVGFDTAAWREEVGTGPSFADEDILEEVRAWAEGDVWGVGLEKKVSWSTEDEDFEDFDNWEETPEGFIWGYYGHRWAEQEAKDELKRQLEHDAKK